jgi:hypothetical protein
MQACRVPMLSCFAFVQFDVTKVIYYGNGNSNGIIEVTVFLGGNIDDTVFLGLISSSISTSC